ncbi:hypothetical protein HUU53_02645 [Candidatus Micrarchaeota archaeon]|nr:hypothetical protein [Candidatus Micrarchaeota archaeon]
MKPTHFAIYREELHHEDEENYFYEIHVVNPNNQPNRDNLVALKPIPKKYLDEINQTIEEGKKTLLFKKEQKTFKLGYIGYEILNSKGRKEASTWCYYPRTNINATIGRTKARKIGTYLERVVLSHLIKTIPEITHASSSGEQWSSREEQLERLGMKKEGTKYIEPVNNWLAKLK